MATCGACKTPNVSIEHVQACYKDKYSKSTPAAVVGKVEAPAPAVTPKVVLPNIGRYAVEVAPGQIVHFLITKAKNGGGWNVKTWHASYTAYVGFLVNDGRFVPAHSGTNYGSQVDWILQSPVKAALLFTKTTGRCSICAHELKAEKSVAASMGPVCCKRLGLKHGEVPEVVSA